MANVPAVDIKNAVRIYYERIEIGNSDIKELFAENVGSTRLQSLKRAAKAKMTEEGVPAWNANKVNTRTAFEAWGLNIADLENRLKKLSKFGLT